MYGKSTYGPRTLPAPASSPPRGAVVARSWTGRHRIRRWRGGVQPDRSAADGRRHDRAGQPADARPALVSSESRAGGDDRHGSFTLGLGDAERARAGTAGARVDGENPLRISGRLLLPDQRAAVGRPERFAAPLGFG